MKSSGGVGGGLHRLSPWPRDEAGPLRQGQNVPQKYIAGKPRNERVPAGDHDNVGKPALLSSPLKNVPFGDTDTRSAPASAKTP